MLRTTITVGLLALVPSAAGVLPADAAKKKRPTACQRLKGADRAPAKTVKLVKRSNRDNGSDLVGCVLPAGHVRTIASSEHYDTADFSYRIRQVAGRFVLLSTSGGNQYAFNSSTAVWDLRSGRSYAIARACIETGGAECEKGGSMTAAAAFVTSAGRAVAAVVPATGTQPAVAGAVTIASFDPSGGRTDLDAGTAVDVPPSSLALNGTIASWTHGGAARSADLSAPG